MSKFLPRKDSVTAYLKARNWFRASPYSCMLLRSSTCRLWSQKFQDEERPNELEKAVEVFFVDRVQPSFLLIPSILWFPLLCSVLQYKYSLGIQAFSVSSWIKHQIQNPNPWVLKTKTLEMTVAVWLMGDLKQINWKENSVTRTVHWQ